ncbi:hypothetical protein L7F22_065874 [Adiantum nelumboides]|nr:hypothetical protein [Adiantum nelumboides]
MMNAKEILDHFAQRLARLEVSGVLPAAEAVLRLPSPPLDLHSFTSSYQGTPVLFPASWAPTSSRLSLTDLLRDSLQVEVFRLQYKQTDEPWHLEEEANDTARDFAILLINIIQPITTLRFIASETVKQRNVWMGSLVTSRIHFDALDNLHVCLSGGKIVHLYPPSELPNMYPEPWNEGSLNNFSQIGSVILANERDHARYFRCKRFRAELREGEAIFIPAGWWHEVFTLQQTLSVNVWLGPSSNARFRPTLLHLKSDKYLQFMLSYKD